MNNPDIDIRIFSTMEIILYRRPFHRKGMETTLKMVMIQYRSPDYWQISIGTYEIMGKKFKKIKKPFKGLTGNLHGDMFMAQHNTVFIVIHIRRVLKIPSFAMKLERKHAKGLPCRVINPSGITNILRTKQTFGISNLGSLL
jgi:hypothetical protein